MVIFTAARGSVKINGLKNRITSGSHQNQYNTLLCFFLQFLFLLPPARSLLFFPYAMSQKAAKETATRAAETEVNSIANSRKANSVTSDKKKAPRSVAKRKSIVIDVDNTKSDKVPETAAAVSVSNESSTRRDATKLATAEVEASVLAADASVETGRTTPNMLEGREEAQLRLQLRAIDANFKSLRDECHALCNSALKIVREKDREINKLRVKLQKVKRPAASVTGGVNKPGFISRDLAAFIGAEDGQMVARTQVTKYIAEYIDKHGLKDASKPKCINPDRELKQLLQIPDDGVLTWTNMQRYINHHFLGFDRAAASETGTETQQKLQQPQQQG